jgi:hypothetical protein
LVGGFVGLLGGVVPPGVVGVPGFEGDDGLVGLEGGVEDEGTVVVVVKFGVARLAKPTMFVIGKV